MYSIKSALGKTLTAEFSGELWNPVHECALKSSSHDSSGAVLSGAG